MARRTYFAGTQDRGSALVSAVALTFLLAVLAVLAIEVSLNTIFLERRSGEDVRTQLAFESAFSQAIYRVAARPGNALRYHEDFEIETELGPVVGRFVSPKGRLDINATSPRLLQSLLRQVGVLDPAALAAAIADWRDGDDLRAPFGAEAGEYRAVGRSGPANRFFRHEEELTGVLGMTPETFACLRSDITVSTGEATPDLRFASRRLRRALLGTVADSASPGQLPPVVLAPGDLVGLELRLEGETEPQSRINILMRITGIPDQPFWIQVWESPPAAPTCGEAVP